jgi:alanyl-tRNA synthetase
METDKLYYEDAFLREFTATVLCCEQASGGWDVVLDRTAFYPEGGGQPADHGTLGTAAVTDVQTQNGVIRHRCTGPLEAGTVVTGNIDWDCRFDLMQQHSGEHIVSGLICSRFGCDNVGFHIGAELVTIDFNRELTWDQLLEVERDANAHIWADAPVEILWPDTDALAALHYRSKKALEGPVRIVRFPGADTCACCGTHVHSTGQVGLVKLLSCQKFRDGVRIELLCGGRALRYLSLIWEQNQAVSHALSAKPLQTAEAVARMQSELAEAKCRTVGLENQLFETTADGLRGAGDVLLFQEELSSDALRRLAVTVSGVCGGFCAVFSGADGSYKYAVSQPDAELSDLARALNAALQGRGGGRGGLIQGSVKADPREIGVFFETLKNKS